MKVDPNHDILEIACPGEIKKDREPAGKEFGVILEETIGASSEANGPTPKAPAISGIPEMLFEMSPSANSEHVADRTERFLGILDEYRQKLGNPKINPREIYPLINELEREKEGLKVTLNSLPKGDGLRDILNQALITSSLEEIRFNRGDYNGG